MYRVVRLLPCAAIILLAIFVMAASGGSANAHVKWFNDFNVTSQPLSLENFLHLDFAFLIGSSILTLMIACLLEGTTLGAAMARAMDRVTCFLRDNDELILRAGCAFFFVAIWGVGGILLTPELKTNSTVVAAIQLGIAAGMLSRRTMPLSGLGIVALFAIAVWQYGTFHLADYPIFLGVAVYLALVGLERDLLGARPIDVVRWTAAVTLMWASIEKWAYPEWSLPLLIQHPNISLGLDPEFFMRTAGAVEFTLAFALLCSPLVRRFAAVVLTAMFAGAVFEFGKIDMIGHTLIMCVLLVIIADNGGKSVLGRYPWLTPLGYTAALSGFITIYYAAHAMLYGTLIT